MVEHAPDQLGFLGVKNGLDLDHTVFGIPTPDASTLEVAEGMRVLAVLLHEGILAAHLLEVRRGHEPRMLEQQDFVRGCGNAKHRTHLGVRDFAAAKRIADRGEAWELAGDPDVLTGHDQAPADAPRQPVGTGKRALRGPSAALVELMEVHEQPVGCSIEMRGLLGDPLSQMFQLTVHVNR